MGLISNITGAARWVGSTAVNTGTGVKNGVLYIGEEVSRKAYDVYDLRSDGFEKWTKAGIANLKLAGKALELTALFKGVVETLEGQKNIYYATKFFGSICNYFKLEKVGEDSRLSLAIPKIQKFVYGERQVAWNHVVTLYDIGNIIEVLKFSQKMGIAKFEWASKLGTQIGNFQVFNKRVGDIPVVGSLSYSPKDFFIFVACMFEAWSWGRKLITAEEAAVNTPEAKAEYRKKFIADVGNWLKLTGTIGKMVLIRYGSSHSKAMWFAVADAITQNAGLIKFWMDRSNNRDKRFKNPAAAA